jgi:uncharacterized coiled-coil protein SlyX
MPSFELSEDGRVAVAEARRRVDAFNESVAADTTRPMHVPFLYVEQLVAELDRACKTLAPKQAEQADLTPLRRPLSLALERYGVVGDLAYREPRTRLIDEVLSVVSAWIEANGARLAPAAPLTPVEADPEAPQNAALLPAFWDARRAREGKPDKSRCAAELRVALAVPVRPAEQTGSTLSMLERQQDARIIELEAQNAAAEKTLYDIAGALDYVNYGEGTGGYQRIDDKRLVAEVSKAQQAVRCVEERGAHLRDAQERIAELEAQLAAQPSGELLSDEEAEGLASAERGSWAPEGDVVKLLAIIRKRFPKPEPKRTPGQVLYDQFNSGIQCTPAAMEAYEKAAAAVIAAHEASK